MNTVLFLENTINLSISECWSRTATLLVDRSLSAAYWKLEEMSGEKYLNELPTIYVTKEKLYTYLN